MGYGESSRVTFMNYTYEISNDNDFGMIIIERYKSNVVTETRKWPVTRLLNELNSYDSPSFQRTKKWVENNHPELLL
jgi:hypothetical protein